MGWGLAGLRRNRIGIARLLVALLMLPAVLGLLPKPALTQEQAFAAALAASRCTGDSSPQIPDAPGRHDHSCILCQVSCPLVGPALQPDTAAFPAPPRLASVAPVLAGKGELPKEHRRFEGVPRGPPLSV